MKKLAIVTIVILIALTAVRLYALARSQNIKRVGMIIGIKPDKISAYEALHAASNPGVRDLLTKYHMNDFSIFIQRVDDSHYYLFGYYEYTGSDYEGDMARLAAEPRNKQWLSTTDPLQIPLPGQKSWTIMNQVYHNQ
ncbi:MAG: L-rhamnose mutarotase [Candidatus Dormibacteria bacterium]